MATTNEEKYLGRWKMRFDLRFRVWPVGDGAHRLTWKRKTIPIHGFLMNQWGKLEAIYRNWMDETNINPSRHYLSFEVNDEDAETLAAMPLAGAELDFAKLHIEAPGTLDSKAKQISWLVATVTMNVNAKARTRSAGCLTDDSTPIIKCLKGENLEELVKGTGVEYGKILYIKNKEDIDERAILKAVLEEDAVVVFGQFIPAKYVHPIQRRAKFWVVEGRKPDEAGGILRGYQFSDRFFRWYKKDLEPMDPKVRLSKMHEITRERGAARRRTYFVDMVINRFAERIGMSRQWVTAKFIDDGIVDWLIRSVDGVAVVPMRETSALLRGRIRDAVNAIEFYYRAMENADDSPIVPSGERRALS